ncbi:lamin tail domain-containing protein, partial [Candidatus Latescibacterota bacterium]
MRSRFSPPVIFLSVLTHCIFSLADTVIEHGTVVINEVMFNPDGNENAREYVEILNLSGEPVSLEGWIVGDGTGFDLIVPFKEGVWNIPADSFGLIMDPDYFEAGEPYSGIPGNIPLFTVIDKAIGSRGLSNSAAEPVYLISDGGDTLSVVTYDTDCSPGHSESPSDGAA